MTADGGDACRANIAYAAKLFSSVDVRDMYLDRRDLGCLQGIEKRDARMGVGTGIQDDAVDSFVKAFVNVINERSLVVALEAFHRNARFLCMGFDPFDQIDVALVSVNTGLAYTEKVRSAAAW